MKPKNYTKWCKNIPQAIANIAEVISKVFAWCHSQNASLRINKMKARRDEQTWRSQFNKKANLSSINAKQKRCYRRSISLHVKCKEFLVSRRHRESKNTPPVTVTMVNHNKWDSAWPNLLYVQICIRLLLLTLKLPNKSSDCGALFHLIWISRPLKPPPITQRDWAAIILQSMTQQEGGRHKENQSRC